VIIGVVDERLTRELRRSVLRPNLRPGDPLPGDDLREGVHIGATDEAGEVLCTCFVYPDPCPWQPDRDNTWHLRQMATAEGMRGRGIGGQVVEAAVEYAAGQGATLVWCNARERAVPFYARHGFVPHGEIFTDERHTIPHLRMCRELSGAPGTSTH
jgi:predicted GNAT family N-acyltransferase